MSRELAAHGGASNNSIFASSKRNFYLFFFLLLFYNANFDKGNEVGAFLSKNKQTKGRFVSTKLDFRNQQALIMERRLKHVFVSREGEAVGHWYEFFTVWTDSSIQGPKGGRGIRGAPEPDHFTTWCPFRPGALKP